MRGGKNRKVGQGRNIESMTGPLTRQWIKNKKENKSDSENHRWSTTYTVQNISNISRSQSNALKVSILNQLKIKITMGHIDDAQVNTAPPIISDDPVKSIATLKRLHTDFVSASEHPHREKWCGSRKPAQKYVKVNSFRQTWKHYKRDKKKSTKGWQKWSMGTKQTLLKN